MKTVITVVGRDCVGILSKVSSKCAQYGLNIIEVSQSVLQDMFCMIMLADISKMQVPLSEFGDDIRNMGKDMGMDIHVMHEDIFNSMHRI